MHLKKFENKPKCCVLLILWASKKRQFDLITNRVLVQRAMVSCAQNAFVKTSSRGELYEQEKHVNQGDARSTASLGLITYFVYHSIWHVQVPTLLYSSSLLV